MQSMSFYHAVALGFRKGEINGLDSVIDRCFSSRDDAHKYLDAVTKRLASRGVELNVSVREVPANLRWIVDIKDKRDEAKQSVIFEFFPTEEQATAYKHKFLVDLMDEQGFILRGSSLLDNEEQVEIMAEHEYEFTLEFSVYEVSMTNQVD